VKPSALFPIDLGDGVALTLTTAAEADEIFAVVDRERDRLREWLPWVDTTTDVEIERRFLETLEVSNADNSGLHTTIRDDDGFLGMVGLRINLMHASAEVGYWLAAAATGRGVITKAVAALVDVSFGVLGLHRFELLAATGNKPSRAVAERLGMTQEGVRREAEELASGFVDLAAYAVLVSEWPGSVAALDTAAAKQEILAKP
jgi:ribosomal-protein-serine acetyltransferase